MDNHREKDKTVKRQRAASRLSLFGDECLSPAILHISFGNNIYRAVKLFLNAGQGMVIFTATDPPA